MKYRELQQDHLENTICNLSSFLATATTRHTHSSIFQVASVDTITDNCLRKDTPKRSIHVFKIEHSALVKSRWKRI